MRLSHALPLLALLVVGCGNQTPSQGEVLTFITRSLSVAYTGEQYAEEIRLTSGTRPYNVKLLKGGLPPGLSLQNRTITGVVTADLKDQERKVYDFTLEAGDANLSNKVQDFKLEVRRLPPPSLEWQPAQTEVKTETRVPLVLKVPKNVVSLRLFIPIPDGFSFKKLEAGLGRAVFVYKLQKNVLRVDAGIVERLNTVKDQTVLYLTLSVDGSRKLTGKIGYELRNAGKIIAADKLETAKPATPASPTTPPTAPPPITPPPVTPPTTPASPPPAAPPANPPVSPPAPPAAPPPGGTK